MFLPHSATIRQETPAATGGLSYGSPTSIRCQIAPMSQSKAFQDYGVYLSRPHQLIAGTSVTSLINIGALVSYGSRRFKVSTPPALFDIGTIADHVSCVIEEIEAGAHNA